MDEQPFPGMPEPPPPGMKKTPTAGIKVSRIKADRLCEWCCRDIHFRGVWAAPYPRVARWRVTSDAGVVERLCEGHKAQKCR